MKLYAVQWTCRLSLLLLTSGSTHFSLRLGWEFTLYACTLFLTFSSNFLLWSLQETLQGCTDVSSDLRTNAYHSSYQLLQLFPLLWQFMWYVWHIVCLQCFDTVGWVAGRAVEGCWRGCVWVQVQICIWPSWCHYHSLSLAPVNPDWFYFPCFTFLVRLTRVVLDKIQEGRKMVCVCVCVWHIV